MRDTILNTDELGTKRDDPSGPFWTAWSEWYGCSNLIDKRNYCAFPRRYLLESYQYKECVMKVRIARNIVKIFLHFRTDRAIRARFLVMIMYIRDTENLSLRIMTPFLRIVQALTPNLCTKFINRFFCTARTASFI